MNPRITMQTKPLSPFCATSYPDLVSTLKVARSEIFAWAIPGHTAANNTAYIRIAFIMVKGLLSPISLHPLIRIGETLGYGELTSDAHRNFRCQYLGRGL